MTSMIVKSLGTTTTDICYALNNICYPWERKCTGREKPIGLRVSLSVSCRGQGERQ